MKVYIGADHGGFSLKKTLSSYIQSLGHDVVDCGNTVLDPEDDFPDFAFVVAENVSQNPGSRGILICRSAGGMTIAANKVKGIRCVTGSIEGEVFQNRTDDDANILALAAGYTDEKNCKEFVRIFLDTPFSGDARFVRRLQKISSKES